MTKIKSVTKDSIDSILSGLSEEHLTKEEHGRIDQFIEFEKGHDWTQHSKKEISPGNFYTISLHYDKKLNLYSFKGTSNVNITPEDAAVLFTQTKYYKRLNPLCKEIRILDEIVEDFPLRRAISNLIEMPWPLSDREFVTKSINCLSKDRSNAINLHYFDEELDRNVPVREKCVRGQLLMAGFIVRKTKNVPEVAYIIKANLKGMIPSIVVRASINTQTNIVLSLHKVWKEEMEKFHKRESDDEIIKGLLRLKICAKL